ncbi:MAG: family 10 glycosylhydrolase [Firmicutes bacterium]|nr:family 10 glycosylhydrolase [Bacillota bacterium]MDD4263521.1 family 10 glycosylhydrolase [Bacillota bacterium]
MKTKTLSSTILFLLLTFFILSTFVSADEYVTTRIAELHEELKKIEADLEAYTLQMRRLDYKAIKDAMLAISKKLKEASKVAPSDSTAALMILIDVNKDIKAIKPLTDESLPVETRGIWVDNVTMRNIRTRSDVERFFDEMAYININFVIVDAYNNGAATYPSKVAAEHDESQIYDGDVLKDIIEVAHSKNMEVHTLINTFGVGTGINYFMDEKMAWLDKTKYDKFTGTSGHYWISPIIPEAREYVMAILKELVLEYDIDGIQLDYVRYDPEFGYNEYARELYKSLFGIDPFDITLKNDIDSFTVFKTQFVNKFVERAFYELKALKPDLLLSASVGAPYIWYKLDLGQDWATWTQNRNISFICPMSYTRDTDAYRRMAVSDLNSLKGTGYIFTGLGVWLCDEYGLQDQISAARTTAIGGQVVFSSANMKAADYPVLQAGIWSEPAIPTLRDPEYAAYAMLIDLIDRITEFRPDLKVNNKLLDSYLTTLGQIRLAVENLDIRDWDTKDLRESSESEIAQLEPIISSLQNLSNKVKADVNKGVITFLTGERIMVELSKVSNLLEPLLYTAKPFVYVSTSWL